MPVNFLNRIGFLFVCSFFMFWAKAQNPVLQHFTTKEGLISNEIYAIHQDRDGYLWIASESGLSRYNGYAFQNFGVSEGLADPVILSMQEDDIGRMWFHGFSGRLSYWQNDEMHVYKHNDIILKLIRHKKNIPRFFMTATDSLYMSVRFQNEILITPQGIVKKELPNLNYVIADDYTCGLKLVKYGTRFFGYIKAKRTYEKGQNFFIEYLNSTFTYELQTNAAAGVKYYVSEANELFVTNGPELIQINADNETKTFEFLNEGHSISQVIKDKQGRLVIGFLDNGLAVYSNPTGKADFQILEGKFITGLVEDHQGGLWVSTYKSGLYYLANEHVRYYSSFMKGDENVTALEIRRGHVYVGSSTGAVNKWDVSSRKWETIRGATKGEVYAIQFHNKLLWIIDVNEIKGLNQHGYDVEEIIKITGKCATVSIQDSTLFFGGLQFREYPVVSQKNLDNNMRIEHIAAFNRNEIWAGNPWGLFQSEYSDTAISWSQIIEIKQAVSGLRIWNNSVVAATKGDGIYFLNATGITRLSTANGLPSNNIFEIDLRNDDLWITTDKGMSLVKLDANEPTRSKIFDYGALADFPPQNISAIAIDSNIVWIGTENGLFSMNPKELNQSNDSIALKVESVKINGEKVLDFSSAKKHNENNLEFSFLGIEFISAHEITYRFKLLGFKDEKLQETKQRSIRYTNLPPGKYTFQFQAKVEDGKWSPMASSKEIQILKPFWLEIWFIVLLVVFIASVVTVLVFSLLRSIQKKEQLKAGNDLKNIELQLMALRAQMNPHFTFNTLNSIQSFIVSNNSRKASDYLSKFAKLIRLLLDNSRHIHLPLADEIESINVYLELEQLRLNNKFDFLVDIDTELDPEDVYIPSALIQPYVENAIWHGISHKKGTGHISLSFRKSAQNNMLCSIEDNGVGRKFTAANRSSTNTSIGTTLSQERVNLLNELKIGKYAVHIEDLINAKGEPIGTRVSINCPIN